MHAQTLFATTGGGGPASRDVGPLLLWLGVLIVAVIAMFVVVMMVRRWMLSRDHGMSDGVQMETLRELRDRGALSPEEYEKVKRTMAERMAGKTLAGDAKAKSGRGDRG